MLNHTITHDFHYNGDDQEEKIDAAEAADARTATEEIRRRTNNSRAGLNIGFRRRMIEKSHSADFITAMSEWRYVGTRISTSSREDCECGAKIKYINHVENTITGHEAQLGNGHLKCVLPDSITSEIVKGNTIVISNHTRMRRRELPQRFPEATIAAMEDEDIITPDEAGILRRQPVDIRELIAEGNADASAIVNINVRLANRLDLETQEINNINFFENYNIDPASCLFCLNVFERDDIEQRICDACTLEIGENTNNLRVNQPEEEMSSEEEEMLSVEEEIARVEEEIARVEEGIAEGIVYSRNKVLSDTATRVDRTFRSTILANSTETQDFKIAMDEWKCNGPMRISPRTRSASGTIITNVHEIFNPTTGIVLSVKKRRIDLCKNILPFIRCQICHRRAINPDRIKCDRCRFS